MTTPICRPRYPDLDRLVEIAKRAQDIRPANLPDGLDLDMVAEVLKVGRRTRLMLDIELRWPEEEGVHLQVAFVDGQSPQLRRRILHYMNLWSETANVSFAETNDARAAQVRITCLKGDGHWSYLGLDVLDHSGPTMNLDGFCDGTSERDLERVVCHETGHTLGFPHEHMHPELVARMDWQRTIDHFTSTQPWTPADVEEQILRPLDRNRHLGTAPDQLSIMCYQIPGSCTVDGAPILGGERINQLDREFASVAYPLRGA